MTRLLLLAALALAATAASAQTAGTISADDPVHINDKRFDAYPVELETGDVVEITMTSSEFDTYLYVNAPSGRNIAYNDDCTAGDLTTSCLALRATSSGTYEVLATTYSVEETGAYTIELKVNGEPVE